MCLLCTNIYIYVCTHKILWVYLIFHFDLKTLLLSDKGSISGWILPNPAVIVKT